MQRLLWSFLLMQVVSSVDLSTISSANVKYGVTSKHNTLEYPRSWLPLKRSLFNKQAISMRHGRIRASYSSRSQQQGSEPNNATMKQLAEVSLIPIISDVIHIFNMSEDEWRDIDDDEITARLNVFYRHLPRMQYAVLTGSRDIASRHIEHSSKIIDGGSVVANALCKILLSVYQYKANKSPINQLPIRLNGMRLMAISFYHHYLKQDHRACRSILQEKYPQITIPEDLQIGANHPYQDEMHILHLALLTIALGSCTLTKQN